MAKIADLIVDSKDVLGEGPHWCATSGHIFWVDVMSAQIKRFHVETGKTSTTSVPFKLHAIREVRFPWFVGTMHSLGVVLLNVDTKEILSLANPERDNSALLLNDGRCDAQGRFWFGSLHKKHEKVGSLYVLGGDAVVTRVDSGFETSNGICFSQSGDTLYFADTYQGLLKFELDGDRSIKRKSLIATPDTLGGLPDGIAADEDGHIWCALALAGKVVRVSPAGKIVDSIEVPCLFVTSCSFGGPRLDTLFITTATAGRSREELEKMPSAGGLFAATVASRGLAESAYRIDPSLPLTSVLQRAGGNDPSIHVAA